MRNDSPLSIAAIASGLIVTIIGGIIVAIIVGEGRFAVATPTTSVAQRDVPASPTLASPTSAPSISIPSSSTPVPPTLTPRPSPTPSPTLTNTPQSAPTEVSVSIPIRSDNQDGYENPTFHISGDGLADDWVGTGTLVQAGWIFTNVNIPRGARILNSYVRFRGFGNGGSATARFRGFAEDNAVPFAQDGTNKPSKRPLTNAFVDWTQTWAFQWQWFQTPDLSPVIQEIVNRPGWVAGNNIGLNISNPLGKGTNWAVVDYAGIPYDGKGGAGHSVTLYITFSIP